MTADKSDLELLARIAAGDQDAFARLVRCHQGNVFNLAYRFSRGRPDAEDLTQEIFFKVWRHARSFKGQAAFSTWLYRLAVNACLNYRKKKKSRPESLPLPGDLAADTDAAGAEIIERERQRILDQAVDALPVRQKMVLILAHFESKSYEEIAAIMNISISAVETLLFRARQNLGKILKPLKNKGAW
ncbi:MAG: sigma-70 family RNA polymerase sigma factor [Candidatus Aminicenantes bacterium]|nr:sigma-70 family RNA polymerase sigma factor [Candidatus Aminicenantes bacterium]